MHFSSMSVWIPTGSALRWAQKDEGGYSDPPYIPLDSHYPSETLGRYEKRYSSQAPFTAHAGEQVATVLWRSGDGRRIAESDPFENAKPALLQFCRNRDGFLWRFAWVR